MKINSLSFRLAAGAALWITAALVVTGFVLSGLFRDYVERGFEQQLAMQLDRLSSVSEIGPGGALELKRLFSDPRFEKPYSGWYWQVAGRNRPLLRSRSLWDQVLTIEQDVQATDTPWRSEEMGPEDQHLWVLRRAVTFPGSRGVFQIAVAADISEMHAEITRFTGTLALFLAILGLGLIAAVIIQVRYGLLPLARLRDGLGAVRSGRATRLAGPFPDEVTPLAEDLNGLLDHNAQVVERARTHVGNLAHALKTPLSVVGNAAAAETGALAETTRQQVAAMSDQIDHHLSRARTVAAGRVLGERTGVSTVAEELRRTLSRIYRDRGIQITVAGRQDLVFLGERQDLQEMIGNLMDNACKWAKAQVCVTLEHSDDRLRLRVEDDGPGLEKSARDHIFGRGQRHDEAMPGSGLGLAIVRDVAELYGGGVSLHEATLGGFGATLDLPAA
ncbi:MAG: ATP-binding protein [Alphaproteobacteria bacterium]